MLKSKLEMDKIRTRFAPSPTGFLHIGGLRTAAYSYILAKHFDGDFLLRIEDTDQKREVAGATEKIYETLKIFGLNWDEEPLVQSQRAKSGAYLEAAERLVKDGHAFYCDCPPRDAKHQGYSKILKDPCRDKNLKSGAIKLKIPNGIKISYRDFVLDKEITWETDTVADATLLKSESLNRLPTYHLAAAVDDIFTGITHVLRGHDWHPSTPIHILVHQYLNNGKVPEIGHATDILSPNGGKLSKRRDSVSCEEFLGNGYLPEAILNFIILLGWAPKDNRELFTLKEFVKAFDIKGFQKSNPLYKLEKLDWLNGVYLRQKSDKELMELLKNGFIPDNADMKLLARIIPLVKERIVKLSDFSSFAGFFFEKKSVDKTLLGKNYKDHLSKAVDALEKGSLLDKVPERFGFKVGDFFMDLRITITGSKFTPPINESIEILGKEESIKRIKAVLQ
ncbi:MAG: glutamate--tRNA ligase [Patescibacteria group bacterium]